MRALRGIRKRISPEQEPEDIWSNEQAFKYVPSTYPMCSSCISGHLTIVLTHFHYRSAANYDELLEDGRMTTHRCVQRYNSVHQTHKVDRTHIFFHTNTTGQKFSNTPIFPVFTEI